MRVFTFILLVSILLLIPSNDRAQSLTWLGTLGGQESRAEGVSADGSVVVGDSYNATGWQRRAFIWTPVNGMQDLGTLGGSSSGARDVSADGSTITGWAIDDTNYVKAFLWTSSGGMTNLGALPGGHESEAFGISANGSVVVGEASGNNQTSAFRWENGFMQSIALSGGSRANAVSDDGSTVVGHIVTGITSTRAFRWTSSGGMQDLGTLGGDHSEAHNVSADGTVVVGYSKTTHFLGGHAFRWTESGGMQDLGTLGGVYSRAYAVSADGSIVVGLAELANSEQHAFIWRADSGMQNLNVLYDSLIDSKSYLNFATDISPDGRYIVGVGYNGNTGRFEAFLLDTGTSTGIDEETTTLYKYQLFQNYPNPFNPTTTIYFSLPHVSRITLHVYDLAGRKVRTLANELMTAGTHTIQWDGTNDAGQPVASGIYLCRLETGNYRQTKQMILLR